MRPALAALLSAVMISAAERRPGEPCETAQHHEFDFVVGNWLVRDASGRVAGTATVAKAYGGCVLIETWLGVGSASGSLGVIGYQQKAGRWHRDFLDSGGVVLSLEGQREGPAMVMTGKDYPADGPRLHRVTWSAQGDGTVQEQWYTSVDAGRSWQVKFDGVFHRIAE